MAEFLAGLGVAGGASGGGAATAAAARAAIAAAAESLLSPKLAGMKRTLEALIAGARERLTAEVSSTFAASMEALRPGKK